MILYVIMSNIFRIEFDVNMMALYWSNERNIDKLKLIITENLNFLLQNDKNDKKLYDVNFYILRQKLLPLLVSKVLKENK